MADVYILNCKENASLLLNLLENISPSRRERANKMRKQESKLACIGSEVLLASALGLTLPLELGKAQNGKPYLDGEREFNISHSGDYVICAVGKSPVGADIERVGRVKEAVFGRIASPLEKEAAERLSPSEKEEYYCSVWTKKESLLKLTGEGIRKELSTVCTERAREHFFTQKLDNYLYTVCTAQCEQMRTHFIAEETLRQSFNI